MTGSSDDDNDLLAVRRMAVLRIRGWSRAIGVPVCQEDMLSGISC